MNLLLRRLLWLLAVLPLLLPWTARAASPNPSFDSFLTNWFLISGAGTTRTIGMQTGPGSGLADFFGTNNTWNLTPGFLPVWQTSGFTNSIVSQPSTNEIDINGTGIGTLSLDGGTNTLSTDGTSLTWDGRPISGGGGVTNIFDTIQVTNIYNIQAVHTLYLY